jgi:hypothetical protein
MLQATQCIECSQDVVILEVNSGLFVFGKEKGTGYDQTISGISSYKKHGGKSPKNTPLQKVYDTDDETAKGNRTGKRDMGNLACKAEQGERRGIRRKDIKDR